MFAGNFAPAGWMLCDGALLPISENETLFQLIGTTFGGDGEQTFGLPDLRGRAPIHQGTGPGGESYVLAQSGGSEQVTLTANQIPAHGHKVNCGVGSGTQVSPQNGFFAATPGGSSAGFRDSSNSTMNAGSTSNNQGGQPHENMMPFLATNYIISLFGIFPSQT
jgi:microcystin-dependent protein